MKQAVYGADINGLLAKPRNVSNQYTLPARGRPRRDGRCNCCGGSKWVRMVHSDFSWSITHCPFCPKTLQSIAHVQSVISLQAGIDAMFAFEAFSVTVAQAARSIRLFNTLVNGAFFKEHESSVFVDGTHTE